MASAMFPLTNGPFHTPWRHWLGNEPSPIDGTVVGKPPPHPATDSFFNIGSHTTSKGVSSQQVVPREVYPVAQAIDDRSFLVPVASEPIFTIIPNDPANQPVLRLFSLAKLNLYLQNDHELLMEYVQQRVDILAAGAGGGAAAATVAGRKRKNLDQDSRFIPEHVFTESTLSKHLRYLGLAADTNGPKVGEHGGNFETEVAIGKAEMRLLQARGKIDCAPIWIGNLCTGDYVGFVIKRMNKSVPTLTNGVKLVDLLDQIGPLQVLPVATSRKNCYPNLSFSDDMIVLDKIENAVPKLPVDYQPLPRSTVLEHMTESYTMNAFLRGTLFATIDFDALKHWAMYGKTAPTQQYGKRDWGGAAGGNNSFFANVQLRSGQIINVGQVMNTFTENPPPRKIAKAIAPVPGVKEDTDFGTADISQVNQPFAQLLGDYGFHLNLRLDKPRYSISQRNLDLLTDD